MIDKNSKMQEVLNGLISFDCYGNASGVHSLEDRMNHYHTPGVSIAVIEDNKIDWSMSFGFKQASRPDPVETDTIFQAGSVSKPVFALAVMRLVEQGVLDLDTDVNTYLKSWKVPDCDCVSKITLRQLLGHVAGLTTDGFRGYLKTQKIPTVPQILDGLEPANSPAVRINMLPGTQFRYSGGGTTVAQLVVEDVLGKPLNVVMKEQVFDPLGLTLSCYDQPLPDSRLCEAATGHPFDGREIIGGHHVHPELGAAGLWSTPTELAQLALTLQKCLKGESDFLTKESMEIMTTPFIEPHMGVGFFTDGKGEDARFGHTGWNEGFVTKFHMYKYHGKGAVIMLNSNEGVELFWEIERAIAKAYGWPGYFKPESQAKLAPANDILVGTYFTEFGSQLDVSDLDGSLVLSVGQMQNIPLYLQGENRFAPNKITCVLEFHPCGMECRSLTLEQNGKRIRASKISK